MEYREARMPSKPPWPNFPAPELQFGKITALHLPCIVSICRQSNAKTRACS